MVAQLVDYYKKKEILISIDGQQNVDAVESEIKNFLGLN